MHIYQWGLVPHHVQLTNENLSNVQIKAKNVKLCIIMHNYDDFHVKN